MKSKIPEFPITNCGTLWKRVKVSNEKAQDAIYTITGTRISKITTSGIYIINGKKKVIK